MWKFKSEENTVSVQMFLGSFSSKAPKSVSVVVWTDAGICLWRGAGQNYFLCHLVEK